METEVTTDAQILASFLKESLEQQLRSIGFSPFVYIKKVPTVIEEDGQNNQLLVDNELICRSTIEQLGFGLNLEDLLKRKANNLALRIKWGILFGDYGSDIDSLNMLNSIFKCVDNVKFRTRIDIYIDTTVKEIDEAFFKGLEVKITMNIIYDKH